MSFHFVCGFNFTLHRIDNTWEILWTRSRSPNCYEYYFKNVKHPKKWSYDSERERENCEFFVFLKSIVVQN